jgi:hypothetical protein
MVGKPKSVQVGINIGILQLAGTWEPNEAERRAAWELYVELITRVTLVPLPRGQGLLREALSSLYSLFGSTRSILRDGGPAVAQPTREGDLSFGYLAVAILNLVIRPLLVEWHPVLLDWEAQRAEGRSSSQHESDWEHAAELRAHLEDVREALSEWASVLAAVNGIPDLSRAVAMPDDATS